VLNKRTPVFANYFWLIAKKEGSRVNRINTVALIGLGKYLQALSTVDSSKLVDIVSAVSQVQLILGHILSGDLTIDWRATRKSALELQVSLGALMATNQTEEAVIKQNLQLAQQAAARFEVVVANELPLVPIYTVDPVGVFSTDALLDHADSVFGILRQRMPPKALDDTKQAGRCLAFELPTASGFHIARATESVITSAMEAFKCEPLKESQRNWGKYIEALEGNGANKKVIQVLRQIKDLHRNPMVHPEVTLSIQEANSLWSICTSAIQGLIANMETRRNPDDRIKEILDSLPPDDPGAVINASAKP
jgi:hypothetical protein